MDGDAIETLGSISKTEKSMKHPLSPALWNPAPAPPRDYFVPDFGVDFDVATTLQNAGDAEYATGYTFVGAKPPKPADEYTVPDFGEDAEIETSR